MTTQLCQFDRECLASQACYTNVSWYVPEPGQNGCLCSTYYGWTGPLCDRVGETNTSRFWLAMGIIMLIILVIALYISVNLLVTLFRRGMIALKAETVGNAQTVLSCCFGIIYEIGFTWAAYSPSYGGYIPGNPDSDRQNLHHRTWQACNALFVVFAFGAAMTIALVWIDIAKKAKSLSKGEGSMRKFQIWMTVFQVVILIALIVPLIVNSPGIASLVAYVLVICLLATYLYGYKMMTGVIATLTGSSSNDASDSQRNPYKAVLKEMRRTTAAICGIVIVAAVFCTGVIFTVFLGWKEVSKPDPSLSLPVFFTKLLALSVACLNASTLHFLRQCANRQIRRQEALSSSSEVMKMNSNRQLESHTAAN